MPSDRARATYDESRCYRSVVMQQGRVLLEADWNEDEQLDAEMLRRETRDFVGPVGTPDDGFKVSAAITVTEIFGGFLDRSITMPTRRAVKFTGGTMYIGGVRGYLPPALLDYDCFGQPDWLVAGDPPETATELIYLELFEQEISGVEDPPLIDPALGGPDTAQRLRIMHRVHRQAVNANTCVSAWNKQVDDWTNDGYFLDRDNQLHSSAGLQVGFDGSGLTDDPCDPSAQPGYLGADNQMIRVAVAQRTDGNPPDSLVWSFDDASAVYLVGHYDKTAKTLKLVNRPVDAEHAPKSTQVVELLRGTAMLDPGANPNVIAAEPFGPIVTLSADYSAGEKTLTLTDPLPSAYEPTVTRPLYVRVWQERLPLQVNTPIKLGKTGITITLSVAAGPFHAGDFWTFAVRPFTRTKVHPVRYQNAAQPPEGLRRWVCPLAIVDWSGGEPVVKDCRETFDDLVTLSKRPCCVVVRPKDLERRDLQEIIDYWTAREHAVAFCLTSGHYRLTAPLVITGMHGPIIIEGCGPEVNIEPADASNPIFLPGLIQIVDPQTVRLRGLTIMAPAIRQFPAQPAFQTGNFLVGASTAWMGIGIRVIKPGLCGIDDCIFFFSPPPALTTSITGSSTNTTPLSEGGVSDIARFDEHLFAASFGAAVLTHGNVSGMELSRNIVAGLQGPTSLFGFVFTPSVDATGNVERVDLLNVIIEDNTFLNLRAGVLAWGGLSDVAVRENHFPECSHGILLFAQRWFPYVAFLQAIDFQARTAQVGLAASIGTAANGLAGAGAAALECACFSVFHPSIVVPTSLFASLKLPTPANPPAFELQPPKPIRREDLIDALANPAKDVFTQGLPATMPHLEDELAAAWGDPSYFASLVNPALRSLNLIKAFETEPLHPSVIDVSHNEVSLMRIRNSTAVLNGSALVVLGDDRRDSPMRITVSESHLEGSSAWHFPTALLLLVRRCTVTGNIIQNEPAVSDRLTPSLILEPIAHGSITIINTQLNATAAAEVSAATARIGAGAATTADGSATGKPDLTIGNPINQTITLSIYAVAITGNVFVGFPLLPVRRDNTFPLHPAPPPEWLTYNTWVD